MLATTATRTAGAAAMTENKADDLDMEPGRRPAPPPRLDDRARPRAR